MERIFALIAFTKAAILTVDLTLSIEPGGSCGGWSFELVLTALRCGKDCENDVGLGIWRAGRRATLSGRVPGEPLGVLGAWEPVSSF